MSLHVGHFVVTSDVTESHCGILEKLRISDVIRKLSSTLQERYLEGYGVLSFLRVLQKGPVTHTSSKQMLCMVLSGKLLHY